MATREELMTALRNADAAGDTEAAERLAAMIPSEQAAPQKPADFSKVEPETFTDRAALAVDRGLKAVGNALPDWLPSRQSLVNTAAGASTVGGLLSDAPRIKNVADKNSGAYVLGQVLDPVMAATGGKAFQAITQAPKMVERGRLLKNTIGGAGAGAATSLPMAVKHAGEGEFGEALGDVGTGSTIGAAFGPAMSGMGWLGDKTLGAAKSLAGGTAGRVSDYLRSELDNLPQVKASVEALRGFLPGEKPTVGMAAGDARNAKLGALEAGSRNRPYASEEFARRDAANRAARERALEEQVIINEPTEQARKDIAGRLYQQADQEQVPVTDALKQIFAGDMVSALRSRAGKVGGQMETNAQVAGRDFNPRHIPGREAPRTDFAMEGQLDNAGPTAQTMSVNELQLLKSSLDDEINAFNKGRPSPTGLTNVSIKELQTARNQLIKESERLSPKWGEARREFADRSQPVNQQNTMQYLLDALRRPAAGEGAASFNAAIKDLPRTMERATGMPRFSSGEQALASLSPLGQRTVQGVQNSLQREADVAKNWTGRQSSLRNIENPADVLNQNMPGVINQSLTIARKALQKVGGNLDEKAQTMLDNAMLDPKAFVDLANTMPASERLKVLTKAYEKSTSPQVQGMIQAQISNLRSE